MSAFRMEEPMPCESPVYDEAIEKLTAPMAGSSEKAATLDDVSTSTITHPLREK